MTAQKAEKIPFTPSVADAIVSLPFEERPVGVVNGKLVTEAVDAGIRDYFVRDASMPGFALRRMKSGKATWYCERKLRGRVCRYVCGEYKITSLAQARQVAKVALAKMVAGIDPNLEKDERLKETDRLARAKNLTYGVMLQRDADNRSSKLAAEGKGDTYNTARDRSNSLKIVKMQPWLWSKPVRDLTADDLQRLMQEVRSKHGDATAIKVWRYGRAAYGRLPSADMAEIHPFDEFLKIHTSALPKPKRKQTYLPTNQDSGQKWLQFIAAQRNPETAVKTGHPWTRGVMADAIITIICLGFRKMEALALKVEDVDFERRWITITEERTKNKRAHYMPLCPGLEMILRERLVKNAQPRGRDVERARRGIQIPTSEYMFPTERRTAKCGHIVAVESMLNLADERSGIAIALHDLRRTYGGEMYSILVGDNDDRQARPDSLLVKQALNHVSAEEKEITLSYVVNIDARVNALRPAAEAHERRIFEICGIPYPIKPTVETNDADALMDALKLRAATDPTLLESLRELMGNKTMKEEGDSIAS